MARGYTKRKLEVWSVSAHQGEAAVSDYEALFAAIAKVPAHERVWTLDNRLVAVPVMEARGSRVFVIAYEGPTDEQPIFLNLDEGQERDAPLDPNEIMATKTHALFDLSSREAIIEYNRRGAKAGDIAAVLGVTARNLKDWTDVWVELVAKVEADFLEAVEAFDRIRVASMKVTRPNTGWPDWEDVLSGVAEDSNAGNAGAEFSAQRGESLNKNRGIVRFIKDRVADAFPGLKNAVIVGSRPDEEAEARVSTGDHKSHAWITARLNERGQIDDEYILERLEEYEDSRRKDREDDAP